jgi:vacuolar-type H+-ATPase subunit I/STV1
MKIYSELTHLEYPTVEACQKAEKEYNSAIEEKKAEESKLSKEKKARADEVANAYKKKMEDEKEFIRLRNKFIQDYGYFHMTYRDMDALPSAGILDMFNFF